jgi:hypothetical protein
MLRLAVREPPAAGAKVTLTLQLPPAAKELPQILFWAKSELFAPPMLMPEMFKEALPVFTRVTMAGLLFVFRFCGAKLNRDGNGVR